MMNHAMPHHKSWRYFLFLKYCTPHATYTYSYSHKHLLMLFLYLPYHSFQPPYKSTDSSLHSTVFGKPYYFEPPQKIELYFSITSCIDCGTGPSTTRTISSGFTVWLIMLSKAALNHCALSFP